MAIMCGNGIYLPNRICEELGSGQFGVVNRGLWRVGGVEREVAVKSLMDGSTEDKEILFLQEAVIMGQFKHPNVLIILAINSQSVHYVT